MGVKVDKQGHSRHSASCQSERMQGCDDIANGSPHVQCWSKPSTMSHLPHYAYMCRGISEQEKKYIERAAMLEAFAP